MGKSSQPSSLADALFGKTKKAVIGILFSKPEKSIHLRELARLADVSATMMSNELARLKSAGIVLSHQDGNRVGYQANQACPIFEELRGIARKTTGLADIIRNALPGRGIQLAFIFGSVATGTEGPRSDVDLMVVGNIDGIELNGSLAPVEGQIGRPIHISHYSPAEMVTVRKDRILKKIFNGPKIMVIGDDPVQAT
jgi:predicted nucleotidyltransferase